jgi:predicted alpha/beta-fold hydrolase
MTDFRPLPFLGNRHLQTVLGTWLPGPEPRLATREQLVGLPDGDRLVLHDSTSARWRPGDPVALLVHGLGGCHRSGYMRRVAGLLVPRGVRAVRMDLRGTGRGVTLARRPYHAGCSDDVRAAAAEVRRWAPDSPLTLVGFSLGGNIVLKLAGEAAARPVPGLERVVAVAPPIDLERCSELLGSPRNRFYERRFVHELLALARRRDRLFPDVPPVRFPPRLTLRGFDDLYTAPRSGFAGALDYYRRAASLALIPKIAVPTRILTARDDPFIAVETFERLSPPDHVEVRISPHGGHLGFLGWNGAGGIRWAERLVVDWVAGRNGTTTRRPRPQ